MSLLAITYLIPPKIAINRIIDFGDATSEGKSNCCAFNVTMLKDKPQVGPLHIRFKCNLRKHFDRICGVLMLHTEVLEYYWEEQHYFDTIF